jgi:serine/threonine protein kinase/Tol biopolymer transport system component
VAETALDLNGRVVGNYRIVRLLGAGAMGKVFLLEHTRLPNTHAALKVLSPRRENSALLRERFVQEAMVAAAIGGDRVARPLDIGQFDAETPYIIMEYVAGRTLADTLDTGGPLGLVPTLTIAYRVADTMALAHARGIIHRDLKPSNIMLTDERQLRVRVLDFGVARAVGDIKIAETLETAVIGSPGYMSPEAATGMVVDELTDVFSLGVTLFKMLSGKLPFSGDNAQATVAAILTRPPLRLVEARPPELEPVSPALEELITTALHKSASERPRMSELRDRLLALLVELAPARGAALLQERAPPVTPLAPAIDVVASTVEDTPDRETMRRRLERFAAARIPSTATGRSSWRLPLIGLIPLALAVGIAAWALTRRQAPPPLYSTAQIFPTQHQLTTSGDITEVEISPDGKTIAYVAGRSIFLRDLDSERARSIAMPRIKSAIVWARDNSAFYYDNGTEDERSLFRVARAGGEPHELPVADQYFDVAPDGKHLILSNYQAHDLRITDLEGKNERRIPIEGEYNWIAGSGISPDGKLMAVLTQAKAAFTLHMVKTDGSRQTALSIPRLIQFNWYDNRSILLLRHEPSALGNQLMLLKLDDSGLNAVGELRTVLPEVRGYNFSTPDDGRVAAYRAGNPAGAEIWTLSLDEHGSFAPRRLTFGTASTCNVSLSPDGTTLAITTFSGHGTRLATVPFGGGEQHEIGHATRCPAAAWSPDGKQLAWRNGPLIEIANLDGSGAHKLSPADASAGDVSLVWLAPERILYKAEGRRPWHVITLADGKIAPYSDDKEGWYAVPRLAPDGKRLAVTWNRQPAGAYEIMLADGTARFVGGPLVDVQGWSSDGLSLLVASRKPTTDEHFELLRLPLAGGTPQPVATLPFSPESSCSFTRDGKRATCLDRAEHADVWIIDNFAELVAAANEAP